MPELNDAQLAAEIAKCDYCATKPCREACPAHCSPADFIMAARIGEPSDIERAAGEILSHNPLGGICGATCPDTHCMAACSRLHFDRAVEIPSVQETIVRKAHRLGMAPTIAEAQKPNGKRVAVIGAGPAGLAAAFTLSRWGYAVEIFERGAEAGGACNLIPEHRLAREVLHNDIAFLLSSPLIRLHTERLVTDPGELDGFDGVVVAVGITEPMQLGVPGEQAALTGWEYLSSPADHRLPGAVAVVGGGAVAVDCAVSARLMGAARVEMFTLETWSEMPLTDAERRELLLHGVQVSGRTRLLEIFAQNGDIRGIATIRVAYAAGDKPFGEVAPLAFDPRGIEDVVGTDQRRDDIQHLIIAIGHRPTVSTGTYKAGDCLNGPTTVVEAAASGKNAAAALHGQLSGEAFAPPAKNVKSTLTVPGFSRTPVALEADFFGRPIASPFLLSAAPPTDGYAQMKRAFEAGWAGGIMKTAFDGLPIHIPSEYMFAFGPRTWANCDNVSGHSLSRVCGEVEKLVKEYPDHLTVASTGGPVSGDDEADAAVWQRNTRLIEEAGAHGIEYSLSCPQGGDGTEGDIVSQNAALTVKIIEWVLKSGDPEVPKLFKLTAAVTSVAAIVLAIKELFARYPAAKAGITLANTFPTLAWRSVPGRNWEEGLVVGMSGHGVAPISNLTLATVSNLGVTVSGNGGPMDYKAAAHFLALGAKTVQFCTLVMKYGYGIIDEMHAGLSYLLRARGLASVAELIGIALPEPVTDFMALPATKRISESDPALCVSCGNCTRCSYFAITLDENQHPVTDPEKCVGCSICAKKCQYGALQMRERTPAELLALQEG